MTLPLDGVLVADFSRVLAGPYATTTLADLGARVIKVERPGAGDDTRAWGPPWTDNSAAYFESANRNKESVTLDLGDPQDRELAKELARRADVFIENFRPGALNRFDLGFEQVYESNPGVVYCSISGFGSGGGAHLPGYDFLVQAVGGLMSITGDPDSAGGTPMKSGVALVDVLTGKDATIGILAGLHARNATGRGQHVEVNLLSSLLSSLVNQASSFLATGTSPGRLGNAHPSIAPYESLPCADGPIAIACGNDGQFRKLAAVLGDESLADDERFATNAARVQNRPELAVVLAERLAADEASAWVKKFLAVGVPAGNVGTIADGFALATELGLEPLVEVGKGQPAQVRNPITFSDTPITQYNAPPRLGEHSDAVRAWLHQEEQ
ncbi:CaiB/BaiF CoA transferase family protein [Leucobacter denitrificans]|uniref:CoA transferase n=1 Tax=Leucobacter denitrificans TaxID=683042 RepID=A0A7G9S437_9MICO|nr:CoA transferase [Leucobacter denitrificans]QNN62612.1 CoA transferase [Leucobacter denitrificans]